MNPLLRLFGMQANDWERVVVRKCRECGQPICEEREVRPLTQLERATDDYANDLITVSEFERAVGHALAVSDPSG